MTRMRGVFGVAAVLLLVGGCSKKADQAGAKGEEAPATPVEVALAKRQPIASVITAEAVLYPLKQATIVPKISAPVQRFFVQRGDHVRVGQLLAVLEDRDLVAAAQESKQLYEQAEATYQNTSSATMPDDLTKAQADVQSASEGLDAAQKVYDSRVKLYREGALAQKLVEDAKVALVQAQSALETARQHLKSLQTAGQPAQLRGAQAQVDAAKAHYASSAAQASYAEVRSPITGAIADRPINVGEMASAGSALFSVVDISRVVARANIPVQSASKIRVNQAAEISSGDAKLKGKVTVVSPTVDPNTTTVQVWVEAANPEEQLKLGTTVHINVSAGEIQDAVVVPSAALLSSDEGGEKVMVAGADSTAREQKVEVGVRTADEAQITKGLKGGEQVIVSGALGLDDKAKIEVSKPGEAGVAKDDAK